MDGAIWCQRVNQEPNKKYAVAITSDMMEMQGNNGGVWIQANMILNKIHMGWNTTVTNINGTVYFNGETNFKNDAKFYNGLRLYHDDTNFSELGVTTLDKTAESAYFLVKSSMAVQNRLQVGNVSTINDRNYSFYVNGSSYVTGTSYTNSGITVTSEKNKKNNISIPSESYIDLFDSIEFKKYKYNDGTSDRFHLGVIAQEVEEAMNETGISSQDFGGLVIDEQGNYFVRYDEINVLTALKVKQLEKRIYELEEKLNTLSV